MTATSFRIGQIVPSSNTTMETEIPAMLLARQGIRPELLADARAAVEVVGVLGNEKPELAEVLELDKRKV